MAWAQPSVARETLTDTLCARAVPHGQRVRSLRPNRKRRVQAGHRARSKQVCRVQTWIGRKTHSNRSYGVASSVRQVRHTAAVRAAKKRNAVLLSQREGVGLPSGRKTKAAAKR